MQREVDLCMQMSRKQWTTKFLSLPTRRLKRPKSFVSFYCRSLTHLLKSQTKPESSGRSVLCTNPGNQNFVYQVLCLLDAWVVFRVKTNSWTLTSRTSKRKSKVRWSPGNIMLDTGATLFCCEVFLQNTAQLFHPQVEIKESQPDYICTWFVRSFMQTLSGPAVHSWQRGIICRDTTGSRSPARSSLANFRLQRLTWLCTKRQKRRAVSGLLNKFRMILFSNKHLLEPAMLFSRLGPRHVRILVETSLWHNVQRSRNRTCKIALIGSSGTHNCKTRISFDAQERPLTLPCRFFKNAG